MASKQTLEEKSRRVFKQIEYIPPSIIDVDDISQMSPEEGEELAQKLVRVFTALAESYRRENCPTFWIDRMKLAGLEAMRKEVQSFPTDFTNSELAEAKTQSQPSFFAGQALEQLMELKNIVSSLESLELNDKQKQAFEKVACLGLGCADSLLSSFLFHYEDAIRRVRNQEIGAQNAAEAKTEIKHTELKDKFAEIRNRYPYPSDKAAYKAVARLFGDKVSDRTVRRAVTGN